MGQKQRYNKENYRQLALAVAPRNSKKITYKSFKCETPIFNPIQAGVFWNHIGWGVPPLFHRQSLVILRLQLHGAIYRPDLFVLMPRYCADLKAIKYESTSLNRIVADKSHRVTVA